jgi:hypothetical protein
MSEHPTHPALVIAGGVVVTVSGAEHSPGYIDLSVFTFASAIARVFDGFDTTTRATSGVKISV